MDEAPKVMIFCTVGFPLIVNQINYQLGMKDA